MALREPQKASFTRENYEFHDRGAAVEGLTPVGVTPRRKDVLLIDGSIFVHPDDGDLRRIEGQLSKAPSIWTRAASRSSRERRANRRRSGADLD